MVRNWEGEVMSLRKTMQLCPDLGFHQVEFEGDFLCRPSKKKHSVLKIHDIQFMLQRMEGWQVRFDYGETNRVAHLLTKKKLWFGQRSAQVKY